MPDRGYDKNGAHQFVSISAQSVIQTVLIALIGGMLAWSANTLHSSSIRISVIEQAMKDHERRLDDLEGRKQRARPNSDPGN